MFVKPAKTMNFFRSVFLVLLEKIVLCFRKPTQSTHPGADWNFQKGQRTFACRQLIFRGARISNTHNMSSGMFIFESTREHRAFHREFLSISKDASVFKPPVRTPICWISFIFGATGTSTSLLHLWDFPSTHNPHTLPSGVVHFENMCGKGRTAETAPMLFLVPDSKRSGEHVRPFIYFRKRVEEDGSRAHCFRVPQSCKQHNTAHIPVGSQVGDRERWSKEGRRRATHIAYHAVLFESTREHLSLRPDFEIRKEECVERAERDAHRSSVRLFRKAPENMAWLSLIFGTCKRCVEKTRQQSQPFQ
jgi:hypothetical protein